MLTYLYSLYGRLPLSMRDRLRWIRHPRWAFASSLIYFLAQGKVVSGPFAGMTIATRRPHLPYILGTQELELHEALERLIALKLERIINVGAADGYYAIGMARRCPGACLIAFETQTPLHEPLLSAAKLNRVFEQFDVRGACSRSDLESILADRRRTLIIVDIEGGELEVLDPEATPGLSDAYILVETHDVLRPGCAEAMARRFSESHVLERFVTRRRLPSDMPLGLLRALGFLMPDLIADTMFEQRQGEQEFFVMVPRSSQESVAQTDPDAKSANDSTAASTQ